MAHTSRVWYNTVTQLPFYDINKWCFFKLDPKLIPLALLAYFPVSNVPRVLELQLSNYH